MGGTNLAIKPGTRTAYLVVGGRAGGFVYTFPILAKGYAGSNGSSMQGPTGSVRPARFVGSIRILVA